MPLLVAEDVSSVVVELYESDRELVVWWATEVECESAISRRERERTHGPSEVAEARRLLAALADGWGEVEPTTRVRGSVRRLLRVHPLRAVDAFQLAAALAATEGEPGLLEIVCLDDRLARAAQVESFLVLPQAG